MHSTDPDHTYVRTAPTTTTMEPLYWSLGFSYAREVATRVGNMRGLIITHLRRIIVGMFARWRVCRWSSASEVNDLRRGRPAHWAAGMSESPSEIADRH